MTDEESSEEDAIAEATRRLAEVKEELKRIRESLTTESNHES